MSHWVGLRIGDAIGLGFVLTLSRHDTSGREYEMFVNIIYTIHLVSQHFSISNAKV